MGRFSCVLAIVLMLPVGCARFGFPASPSDDSGAADSVTLADGSRDRPLPGDLSFADGGGDLPTPKDTAADASVERPSPDASVDSKPPSDATLDTKPPADTTVDTKPPADARVDQALPPDSGPTNACAQGPLQFTYPGATMVICSNPGFYRTQCEVAQYCANPWRLCTASEYLARGGKDLPFARAWLAGCVRRGANLFTPEDGICGDCTATGAIEVDVRWACGTAATVQVSDSAYLGILTSSTCNRIGANDVSTEAFWEVDLPGQTRPFAACCR